MKAKYIVITNMIGAVAAVMLIGLVFGQDIETRIAPVQVNGAISNVRLEGRHIYWTRDFCKARDLHLDSVVFFFTYAHQKKNGIPISVMNEVLGRPVGAVSYPIGCATVNYSAMIPADAGAGDQVIGELWYNSFHPFWLVHQSFGTVTIPGPLP